MPTNKSKRYYKGQLKCLILLSNLIEMAHHHTRQHGMFSESHISTHLYRGKLQVTYVCVIQ